MSQHDLDIANQGFPATRADINNALQALGSSNSGATAPSTTYANQLWYDTANNIIKIRNEDNDAWISLFTLDQTNDNIEALTVNGTITADALTVDTNTLHVDASNNRVGIGTASPDKMLTLEANNNGTAGFPNNVLRFKDSDTTTTSDQAAGAIEWHTADTDNSGPGVVGKIEAKAEGTGASYGILFHTGNVGNFSEKMRINSSGNLLLGKTDTSTASEGAVFGPGQLQSFTRDGNTVLRVRRNTDDGTLIQFYKDSTAIGTIGNSGSTLKINGSTSGVFLGGAGASMWPQTDNTHDLGTSGSRFDDIRATNGTIQTSDQNEKQDIASLTAAEMTAAKAISKLFKTFKWQDKVAAKGDAARIHSGVIAQEVQTAMTDAGLDATNYAFWCSDTWWETSTDVPAVEGVAEVLDDDGNVVTEAVEAQDAYTRIDTYETADEAPEGATERTRLGIRYPELLAFIGAATEQRLADLETRVTALEA